MSHMFFLLMSTVTVFDFWKVSVRIYLPIFCAFFGLVLSICLLINWKTRRLEQDLERLKLQQKINAILDGPDEI